MATSSKKITYTNDFKLKVLDYYFKHGGDNSFGLKTKTAHHFNIDKKTINRMLKNPDMVRKARRLGAKKPILTSPKSGGKNIGKSAKNIHRSGFTSKGSSSTGGTSTPATKTSSSGSSTSSGSAKHSSNTASSSSSGAKSGGGQGNKAALSSGKSGPSGPGRPKPSNDDVEVQVFDLPEDPDYSVLKRSINTSTNGVAGISKLLVTGTPEVQNMLLHECDIIMECKVCRNLFRSVANFLAHKRIYCRENYSDVRSLFHKGETEGVTNQSGTVIVVPEPPSEEAEINESTSSQPVQSTSPSEIKNIATRIVNRQKPEELSSSTAKGNPKYFEKILEVNKKRNLISQDCSVVLEDIAGVTNARFQSYNSKDQSNKSIKCIVDQIQQKSLGLTVVLNEHGQITKTAPGNAEVDDIKEDFEEEEDEDPQPSLVCSICNTSFATRKTLSRHQRSFHEMERTIFSCPMCKNKFFSMWATVKHLQRFHKKSANYIQRVRHTIKERSRVKPIPKKLDIKELDQADGVDEEVEEEDEEEEEEEEEEEDVGKERPKVEPEESIGKENQAVVDQEKVEEKIDKVNTPQKEKEEVAKQSRPQSANSCAVSSDSTGIPTTKVSNAIIININVFTIQFRFCYLP
ncbi:uncharacterized protein LOC143024080 [Oratosquilla oratoria]|uniref:uncharacterized protein LOC143024080 n=1 Tax=Oratosquilla oratoria TaxID=337810 RepID=UPI003F762BB9